MDHTAEVINISLLRTLANQDANHSHTAGVLTIEFTMVEPFMTFIARDGPHTFIAKTDNVFYLPVRNQIHVFEAKEAA
jgi:hypothetical protein